MTAIPKSQHVENITLKSYMGLSYGRLSEWREEGDWQECNLERLKHAKILP